MHLTNYSVNKKNAEYQANADETACQGHKWYPSGCVPVRQRPRGTQGSGLWGGSGAWSMRIDVKPKGHINTGQFRFGLFSSKLLSF